MSDEEKLETLLAIETGFTAAEEEFLERSTDKICYETYPAVLPSESCSQQQEYMYFD